MGKYHKKTDLLRLKVAEWILLGILLFSIALFFIGPDRIYVFIDSFFIAERQAQEEARARLARLNLQAKLNAAKDEQDHIAAERRQSQLEEEKKQQQLQLMEKIVKDVEQDKEREAKFERSYKPTPVCIAPKVWKQKVECANERLRARQRFDELYNAGKL